MRSWIIWLFLLGLAQAVPAFSQGIAATAELVPDRSIESLRPHIAYTSGAPREEISELSPSLLRQLRPIEHASIQFGQVGQSIVAVVPVRNVGDEAGNWILTTGRGSMTSFRLYEDRGRGLEKLIDNNRPEENRRILQQFHAFATDFTLEAGEERTFVIQFNDNASSYVPVQILSSREFYGARRSNVALVSAVVAGSLILIFFNVLMFGATGKPEFIWLGAAEVAFTLNTIHAEGYLTIFVFHDDPAWQAFAGDMLRVSFSFLMLQFGRVFLSTKENFPRLDVALRTLFWLGIGILAIAFSAVFIPAIPAMPIHLGGWLYVMLVSIILPVLAWMAMTNIGWSFWPLLVSWSSVGVYIVYMAIGISGIAPQLPLAYHWVGPIGLFECLMATLALGLHLRQIQLDRIASDTAAKEALLEKLAISNEAARLAEERARAVAAVQSRDRLIEASGHDTRHVLHALNSAIHYTREHGNGDLPAKDLQGLIEASAKHLDEIVATSVSVGNGDASPFMALSCVDVPRVVEDIASIYAIPARDAHLKLVREPCKLNPVVTDEALLARMLSNLVNNAIKFTQEGRVTIDCHCSDTSYSISVSDTGPGMPANVLDQLGARSISENGHAARIGTGWRAIMEIVELLGGDYAIESSPEGTSVEITIPSPSCDLDGEGLALADLAKAAPGFQFFDAETQTREELAEALARVDGGFIPVLVARDTRSSERMWAANHFPLMLVKPLSRAVLAHPQLSRLQSRPTSLASSTS